MENVRNMTIGEKVRAVRLEKGFSQQKLQEKSGVERNFISLVENNHRSPSFKTLMRIADALHVSVGYITDYGKAAQGEEKDNEFILNPFSRVVSEYADTFNTLDSTKFFPAPIINEDTLLAYLAEFEKEHIEDYVFISSKWVEKPIDVARYCCLWVRDDKKALPPLIETGSLICIDSQQRDPKKLEGEIVVFRDPEGGYTIKRLTSQGDHILGLPEEAMLQNPLVVPASKKSMILGKVIWCWSKFEK